MKGLLLKDLYMSRKTIWLYLLMMLIFAAANGTSGVIFALFYAIMIPVNLIAFDERDRFDNLLPMLPVSGIQTVLDKYIVSWCMILLSLVFYAVRCLFPGAEFDAPSIMIGMGICLISQAISLPLIFHFGVERGRMIYLITIMVQAALLGALGSVWGDVLVLVAPVFVSISALIIGVVLSIGSVFVSGRVYEVRCTK